MFFTVPQLLHAHNYAGVKPFHVLSSLLWEWWGAGTGCPERLWMPRPWRCSRPGWMGPWAAWSILDVEVGGPACGGGVGASWSLRSLPTRAILWFCDFCKKKSIQHSYSQSIKSRLAIFWRLRNLKYTDKNIQYLLFCKNIAIFKQRFLRCGVSKPEILLHSSSPKYHKWKQMMQVVPSK